MVDIVPGQGLTFAYGNNTIKIGNSLNKIITFLQENLSIFGTIKMVTGGSIGNDKESDIWIYLVQSGLKIKFDGETQELVEIEVFLMSREQ